VIFSNEERDAGLTLQMFEDGRIVICLVREVYYKLEQFLE